jgi:hypothetical protein
MKSSQIYKHSFLQQKRGANQNEYQSRVYPLGIGFVKKGEKQE